VEDTSDLCQQQMTLNLYVLGCPLWLVFYDLFITKVQQNSANVACMELDKYRIFRCYELLYSTYIAQILLTGNFELLVL